MESSVRMGYSIDDLSLQGFYLAYFILRDRPTALQVLTRARNKLNARCRQEGKRAYWRDKYLKRRVSKITRNDADTLQWLIYFECEEYEKHQEQNGRCTNHDMVIRYIKSLIQMTTGMSSFYVAVGLHRLVHDYSTSDVQRIYEMVTERYLGADEYRRAKRILMRKLSLRFGDSLKTVTTSHGEIRFESIQDQAPLADLVRKCLDTFVPWSTAGHCLVPCDLGQSSALPPGLSGVRSTGSSVDAIETNRCHAFIHSVCFRRLLEPFGFEPPERKLALPEFSFANVPSSGGSFEGTSQPDVPSPIEKKAIQANLAKELVRRHRCKPRTLAVWADGIEQVKLAAEFQDEVNIQLAEGVRLIEITGQDEQGEVLLGTHLLSYSVEGSIIPSKVRLKAGAVDLSLAILPSNIRGPASLALINLRRESISVASFFTVPLLRLCVFASVFVAVGWFLRKEIVSQRASIAQLEAHPPGVNSKIPTSNPASMVVTEELIPYDRATRATGSADRVVVSLRPETVLVKLIIPLNGLHSQSHRAILTHATTQKEVLTEILSAIDHHGSGLLLTIPASLLDQNEDYFVEIRGTNDAHQSSDNIFIFHATKATP